MEKLIQLAKDSTITQGLATLVVLGTDAYLAATGQPIPEVMSLATGAVIGFWFGTKVPYNVSKASGK